MTPRDEPVPDVGDAEKDEATQGTDVESSAPTESGFSRATWRVYGLQIAGPDKTGYSRIAGFFRLGTGPTMTDSEKFSAFLRMLADEIEKGTYPVVDGETLSVPPSGEEAE